MTTSEKTPFYITTAISYPNGVPHIGHAYEVIATDAMARFKRLDGYDVFFMTGTDEHGLKMQQTAEKEGIPVKELADRNSAAFRQMSDDLGISLSRFSSRSRWMVRIRAISVFALRISDGVSSRSVADWNRSWNRCFSVSFRASVSCSSLIP